MSRNNLTTRSSILKTQKESKLANYQLNTSKSKNSKKKQFLTSKSTHTLVSKQPNTVRGDTQPTGYIATNHKSNGVNSRKHFMYRANSK